MLADTIGLKSDSHSGKSYHTSHHTSTGSAYILQVKKKDMNSQDRTMNA